MTPSSYPESSHAELLRTTRMSIMMKLPGEMVAEVSSSLDCRDLTSLSAALPELRWLRPDYYTFTVTPWGAVGAGRATRTARAASFRGVLGFWNWNSRAAIMQNVELTFPVVEVRVAVTWRRSKVSKMHIFLPRACYTVFFLAVFVARKTLINYELLGFWTPCRICLLPAFLYMTTISEAGAYSYTEAKVAMVEGKAREVVFVVGNQREIAILGISAPANVQEVEVTVVASMDPHRAVRSSIPRLARQLGGQAYFGALL